MVTTENSRVCSLPPKKGEQGVNHRVGRSGGFRVSQNEAAFFLKKTLFLERRERGRETSVCEKNQCVDASPTPPTGHLANNPGTRPDQESNQQPFGCWPVLSPLGHTSQG